MPFIGPTALIVAHPGHELFVSSWLKIISPLTFVFTDGSGRKGAPRISSTKAVLDSCGGQTGALFGEFTDLEFYNVVLNQEIDVLVKLTELLAQSLVDSNIQNVIGDSYEEQYLAHDICRIIIDCATELVRKSTGRLIKNYQFPMYGYFGRCPSSYSGCPTYSHRLDENNLSWKLRCAREIPGQDIQNEISDLLNERGMSSFGNETVVDVTSVKSFDNKTTTRKAYELLGEKLVLEGHYKQVIRFQDHVQPIISELKAYCI